jgi:hypothetical protein
MYNEKFVVALKINGKILRENSGIIELPFNSEYSILLKNLNSKDATVNIEIDGKSVTDGNIIIRSNGNVELKGFIKNISLTNRFKFIEKTKQISEYRGDFIEDGIIRVQITYEKNKPEIQKIIEIKQQPWVAYTNPYTNLNYLICDNYNSSNDNVKYSSSVLSYNNINGEESYSYSEMDSSGKNFTISNNLNENGITVNGSKLNEKINVGYIGELEENSTIIVIKLKGIKENKLIEKITTTKEKIKCPICGIFLKSSYKFCPKCGTCLK